MAFYFTKEQEGQEAALRIKLSQAKNRRSRVYHTTVYHTFEDNMSTTGQCTTPMKTRWFSGDRSGFLFSVSRYQSVYILEGYIVNNKFIFWCVDLLHNIYIHDQIQRCNSTLCYS